MRPRPSKTPCRVGVDSERRFRWATDVDGRVSIADLRIPDSAAAAPTGAFDVRFSGPRFVQAEAGMGTNRREVSFQLASVALLPADMPGATVSSGGVSASVPPDVNLITLGRLRISGPCGSTASTTSAADRRVFRLDEIHGRLVVPLGRSRPRAVRVEISYDPA